MIKGVKLAVVNKEINADWGDGFAVRVRHASRRDTMALAAEYDRDVNLRKKKKAGFDSVVFNLKLMDFCLIGWQGLTYKALSQITEGWDFSAEKQEAAIEFNTENKAFVLDNMNSEFSVFLIAAIGQAEEHGQANLGN